MSLTTLLFIVTIIIVFSGAEVLKVLITELLQPAPVLADEGLAAAPLLLVSVVQPADVLVVAAVVPGGPPSGTR